MRLILLFVCLFGASEAFAGLTFSYEIENDGGLEFVNWTITNTSSSFVRLPEYSADYTCNDGTSVTETHFLQRDFGAGQSFTAAGVLVCLGNGGVASARAYSDGQVSPNLPISLQATCYGSGLRTTHEIAIYENTLKANGRIIDIKLDAQIVLTARLSVLSEMPLNHAICGQGRRLDDGVFQKLKKTVQDLTDTESSATPATTVGGSRG